ncbi:MAG: DUF2059 domain-containing protein [Alphaproteobacteria bacterium]|nr:DUF2059 domain-containing protein [Alphaproteobacteria bacterium]
MTRSISVLSVLCLALLTLPFAAVANAQAANADMNARLAAASDLIDAMGGRQSVIDQINRVIPAQMQALQAQFPDLTVETRRLIEKSMRDEMTLGVNQLLTQMANAWARRFTVTDLRQIAAFHRSPSGQRLRAQQEDLQREIAEIGRNWGADIGRRIQQRLQEHLSKPPALVS